MHEVNVSVIVPIYNVELYLEECLESLKRQTLQNIQIILVNDGSTDSSREIAKKYADENSNFILVDRENGGLSAARNTGMAYATGKYVYFLDSDDYIRLDALDILFTRAESENLDVLNFGTVTFDHEKKDSRQTMLYTGLYPDIYSGPELFARMREFHDDNFINCGLIFIRKEVIDRNHLSFYEGILHEDNLYQWLLMAVSKRTAVMNEPLHFRRYRSGSIITTPNHFEKWRGLVVGAYEANKYYQRHSELKETGMDIYIYSMLCTATMYYYVKIDKKILKQREAKEIYHMERKVLWKNNCWRNKSLIAFMISTVLFDWVVKLYNWRK